MLVFNNVKEIVKQLSEKMLSEYDLDLCEDVSSIVYYNDLYKCDGNDIMDRHIDIEFVFGEYYELHDEDELFHYICSLCELPELINQEEIILYQKN
ncbi:MAG: hypothetical protein K2N51_19350 [Lachnospiraceae bacterium]|nr:hypothetical protein [Lachnospiraceae bacterium]